MLPFFPLTRRPPHADELTPPPITPTCKLTVTKNSIRDLTVPSFDLSLGDDEPDKIEPPTIHNTATPSPPRKTRRHTPQLCPLSPVRAFQLARRAIEKINLNAAAPEEDFTSSPISRSAADKGKFAKSPWELQEPGQRRDACQANKFYSWAVTENLNQER